MNVRLPKRRMDGLFLRSFLCPSTYRYQEIKLRKHSPYPWQTSSISRADGVHLPPNLIIRPAVRRLRITTPPNSREVMENRGERAGSHSPILFIFDCQSVSLTAEPCQATFIQVGGIAQPNRRTCAPVFSVERR